MDVGTATRLIRNAVPSGAATWADLGAGTGTFTLAIAQCLGPQGHVIAIDTDSRALGSLKKSAARAGVSDRIEVVRADFREPLTLAQLDGVLLANSLHFVPYREQAAVMIQVMALVRSGGRLVVVDYDGRGASPWVPYPLSSRRLSELLLELANREPTIAGTYPSLYGGEMYAAVLALD
jgi:ubiquinone/menaquinone biosynthesis C-methylase UbiE